MITTNDMDTNDNVPFQPTRTPDSAPEPTPAPEEKEVEMAIIARPIGGDMLPVGCRVDVAAGKNEVVAGTVLDVDLENMTYTILTYDKNEVSEEHEVA